MLLGGETAEASGQADHMENSHQLFNGFTVNIDDIIPLYSSWELNV